MIVSAANWVSMGQTCSHWSCVNAWQVCGLLVWTVGRGAEWLQELLVGYPVGLQGSQVCLALLTL